MTPFLWLLYSSIICEKNLGMNIVFTWKETRRWGWANDKEWLFQTKQPALTIFEGHLGLLLTFFTYGRALAKTGARVWRVGAGPLWLTDTTSWRNHTTSSLTTALTLSCMDLATLPHTLPLEHHCSCSMGGVGVPGRRLMSNRSFPAARAPSDRPDSQVLFVTCNRLRTLK